jgi:arylsulfatase A-like enzyme
VGDVARPPAAPPSRLRVALVAGLALGVAAGLANAVFVLGFDREGVAEAVGAAEAAGGAALARRAPVLLLSVLAHAAIGAAAGAALGLGRRARLRPGAAREPLREGVRDAVALAGAFALLAAAALLAAYARDASNARAVLTYGGLGLGLGALALRGLGALAGAAAARAARIPGLTAAARRLPWRALGAVSGAALLLASLAPPLFAPRPEEPPPPAGSAPPGAPNVLLVVLDTTRADRLSAYGYPRPTTPELDRIAAQGVLYEQAVSAGVWTLPGHAGIFTGAPSSVHGANGARLQLDGSLTTLAELLARHGFDTAGFSNNPWVGEATGMAQGFAHFEDHWRVRPVEPLRLLQKVWHAVLFLWSNELPGGGVEHTLPRALDWIDAQRARSGPDGRPRPFLVFINLMEPHSPLTFRPGFTDAFAGPDDTPRSLRGAEKNAVARVAGKPSAGLPVEAMRALGVLYDGELRYMDHHLGAFVRELERRGLLADTLLVVTADHGEAIGDHGLWSHLQSVYEEVARVPLVLRHPSLPAGRRVTARVQTWDLFRTVAAFAGIPGPLPVEAALAQDLLDPALLDGAGPSRPVVTEEEPAEWRRRLAGGALIGGADLDHRFKAYYDGPLKYVWGDDGRRQLYDLARDPRELRDLAPARPREVERLARALDAWLGALPVDRMRAGGAPVEIDPETRERLRGLGYAE